jgi:Rieske Fe-S protein
VPTTSASQVPAPPGAGDAGRRRFLARVSALGALLGAALLSVPVLRAIVPPAARKARGGNWVKVADDTALLDIGVPIRVNFVQTIEDAWVESRALNGVWLYTADGEKFKAYNGRCTHLGCSYAYDKAKDTFFCPCHRGEFDTKTGAVISGPPPRPLDELEVEVRDAVVFVNYKDFQLGIEKQVEV